MPEIVPSITFTPEGTLEAKRQMDFHLYERRGQLFQPMGYLVGYEFEQSDELAVARVDVEEALYVPSWDADDVNVKSTTLVSELERYTCVSPGNNVDATFSLDWWYEHGAKGVVYPSLQRWLNAGGLTEDVARRAISAMALVYDRETQEDARKYFTYSQRGNEQAASGDSFRIVSRSEVFRFSSIEDKGDYGIERQGRVRWNWIDISTIGSCACWGASGDERSNMWLHPPLTRLYEMDPHNVDYSMQSLSLVLGMAVLAHESVQYEGDEDIFADAEITECVVEKNSQTPTV